LYAFEVAKVKARVNNDLFKTLLVCFLLGILWSIARLLVVQVQGIDYMV
jgi:hypothetical protein